MRSTTRHWKACVALSLLLAALGARAQTLEGSGHATTAQRTVGAFTGIALSIPARVEIALGTPAALSISADDNVLSRIETRVEEGVLAIRFADGVQVAPRTAIRIELRAPSIDSIRVAGAGSVYASGVRGKRLAVEMAGAARIELPALDVDALDGRVSGRGDLLAAGRADTLDLHIIGSAHVEAAALQTQRTHVSINGSAYVTTWTRESIDATLLGSGYVRFYGDPVVRKRVVGSGSILRAGPAPFRAPPPA